MTNRWFIYFFLVTTLNRKHHLRTASSTQWHASTENKFIGLVTPNEPYPGPGNRWRVGFSRCECSRTHDAKAVASCFACSPPISRTSPNSCTRITMVYDGPHVSRRCPSNRITGKTAPRTANPVSWVLLNVLDRIARLLSLRR